MAMLVPTAVLSGCIYFLIFRLMAEQFALPEGISLMLMPVFYKINVLMIIVVPSIFVGVFFWGLWISHRFAGPIERMERDLDEVLAGNWEKRIELRANDDLGGVADRVNRVIAFRKPN
jgi:signal transduction histidine kinase